MNFVNNWLRQLALAEGAVSADFDLPDGTYVLTLSDALGGSATRWEHVQALVSGGSATLQRGQEGSAAQAWPEGSYVYCSLTAAQLTALVAGLAAQATQIDALTARVLALETAGIPADAVRVTAGQYEEAGYELLGWFLEGETFGSVAPAAVDFPSAGSVALRTVYIVLEDGQPALFELHLEGNPSLTSLVSLDVEGIGTMLLSEAAIDWSDSLNRTALGWTVPAHDWSDGAQRLVTFNFSL